MSLEHSATHESYCLHCQTPAAETATACSGCQAPFMGSGRFDRVTGPRPSSMFTALFADRGSA